MKVLFLTNEYPPRIYGGAGVHVDYLSRELCSLMDIRVFAFGKHEESRPACPWVTGFELDPARFKCPPHLKAVFGAIARCLDFNTTHMEPDIRVVHCHTWYSHFGGILAKLIYGIPMVLTVHSLEPLRPWKREQLGGGYDFSTWVEKTAMEMADAIVAVSEETRADVLRLFDVSPERIHVIHNGIDPREFKKVEATDALVRLGVDPRRPYVLFVGRVTRQKGIVHLVRAIRHFDLGFQVVLVGGAPDTPEIAAEMKEALDAVRRHRDDVHWIDHISERDVIIQLYSHASVFCCPSIYEPFGIINLEAMACETPVVASAVGGIKEVVRHGETGYLVPVKLQTEAPFEPVDPERYSADLARRINQLMADPELRRRMGEAGRQRVVQHFSWRKIAEETKALYEEVAAAAPVAGERLRQPQEELVK
jgi:alpha-maltose-1-phosphate synthase